jgi:sugar O-acyltransferase (sialic acid O-acetyltransferase NeuD family)
MTSVLDSPPKADVVRDLVVFGSKYRDLVKLIDAINRSTPTWRLRGFIDDRPEFAGQAIYGYEVLGDRAVMSRLIIEGASVFLNVTGVVANARHTARMLDESSAPVASLIHPSVDLSYVSIGRGAILPEGCVVGSGTVIGDFLAARLHVVISHDVTVGDHVFMGPGSLLGGDVRVGSGAFIGAGATIMPGISIGASSVVGAGSLVHRDVPDNVTVAGVPARLVHAKGRS